MTHSFGISFNELISIINKFCLKTEYFLFFKKFDNRENILKLNTSKIPLVMNEDRSGSLTLTELQIWLRLSILICHAVCDLLGRILINQKSYWLSQSATLTDALKGKNLITFESAEMEKGIYNCVQFQV